MKLPLSIYRDPDPVKMARYFLGKFLMVRSGEGLCGGVILETEAYGGAEDKGCHGYGNRRTARTEPLFAPGGIAYVYLCYGLHNLFNIVTGPADVPQAVLIRSVEIVEGEALVSKRRAGVRKQDWASGPGKVSAALGITRADQGCDLTGDHIWIEDRGVQPSSREISRTPRIGIDYAEEWALKPWRFVWKPAKGLSEIVD